MPLKDRIKRNEYIAGYKRRWRKIPNGAYRKAKTLQSNIVRAREVAKEGYKRLKLDVLNAYGGPVCFCCGETEVMFLGIDHINNDGADHRRLIRNKGGTVMYRWLKNHGYPPGHRVSCHNCNLGRYVNGGICPHQKN